MRTADRTQGIIDRLAGAENYDAIKWILQSGVTTNYTESVVDAKIKANCDFQGRAGLTAKVERVAVGKTCKWCQDVAGEYVYPNVPADVWRRHERCNCIIKYTAATGRVDTLQGSGSTWFITESTDPEAIKNRANFAGAITEPKKIEPTGEMAMRAERYGITAEPVAELEKPLTEEEIIERVSGSDKTNGSCASVSFAYAGNVGGLDVLDFRGGVSQDWFSYTGIIENVADMPGVKSFTVDAVNDFKGVWQVLENAEDGKQYILSTGRHVAVVRKTADGFEYLEMQSALRENTWYPLTDEELKRRFGCHKSHSTKNWATGGRDKYTMPNTLIDIETLSESDEFRQLLPYINTKPKLQEKGVGGFEK